VAVFAIMDAFNTKLEQYEGLDRGGHQRSGVHIAKMQGIVLATHGIYVTTVRGDAAARILNALPTTTENYNSYLEATTKDALLAWNKKEGLQSLMIVIDAQFELKTDRNGVTPAEMQRLTEPQFTANFANALQEFRAGSSSDSRAFDEMLSFMDRTCKGDAEKDIHEYYKLRAHAALEAGTIRLVPHEDLAVPLRCALETAREAYALPGAGHEHSLVHLFGLYGATIRSIDRLLAEQPALAVGLDLAAFRRLLPYWHRLGLLFNGRGVDAQTFDWSACNDNVCLSDPGVHDAIHQMKQVEFKIELETPFNHPFLACDFIVVSGARPDLVHILDSQRNEAQVIHPSSQEDPLFGIGFYLKNIKRGMHMIKSRVDRGANLEIPVLVFRDLLAATVAPFADVNIVEKRVLFSESKKSGRAKASKRKR